MAPSSRPVPPTQDIGSTDLYWGTWGQGLLTDWWETTADLIWPQSVITYGRMRHDPQLRAVLSAFFGPMMRANWVLDPDGCKDKVVQHVADDMGIGILGMDDKGPGPARRRGVIWHRHLRELLYHLVYGHMPFEFRYRYDDGDKLFHLDNLGARMPWTLAQIRLNQDSSIKEIVQTTQAEPIPANRLLWYVNNQEGANWAGISLLRPCFGAWLLKHETWRVHATSIRRFGMGIPTVEAPAGGTTAQVQSANDLASGFRAGDQTGVGLPNGFKFALAGMTGSVPDALGFIKYLDQSMAKMALAQLIELGTTDTGNRALGETFLDLFLLALQGFADEIATTATSGHPGSMPGIVTNIVDVNYGEDEPAPRLVCTDVGENYEITAEALYRLTQTGAMSPDPALDEWIRKTWRIPLRVTEWEPTTRGIPSPGAPAGPVQDPDNPDLPAPAPLPAPPKPAPGKTQKTQTPAARRRAIRATAGLRRPMTAVEAASGFDPLMMKHQHANALGKLMSDYRAVLRTQRNDLVDQVIAAVKSGRPDKLAQLKADPAPGALLIQQAMDTLSQSAVNMMIAEADRQGVVIDAGKVKLPAVKLSRVAQARAALHAAWLSQQAGSKAMQTVKATRRVRAADDEGDEDADEAGDMIDSFLTDLSDVSLKDQLGAALTAAQNTGRVAVLEAAPESAGTAVYTATEINDDNTCEPCADIDGEAFESLSDAEDAYPSGGFVDCEGGLRCRGTVIAVWGGE